MLRADQASEPPHYGPTRGESTPSQRPLRSSATFCVFSATQPRKGNKVIATYRAGHGNRTRVRTLGNLLCERPTQIGELLGHKTPVYRPFLGPELPQRQSNHQAVGGSVWESNQNHMARKY